MGRIPISLTQADQLLSLLHASGKYIVSEKPMNEVVHPPNTVILGGILLKIAKSTNN